MTTQYQAGPSQSQPFLTATLLLKPRDAAIALQLSTRKLFDLTKTGQIPVVRFGRAVRYDPGDLTSYIATLKSGGVR